jgi:two-component system invasion response regulator UvrY
VPDEAVSVLVVDDQAPFRTAARLVVRATRGFEVVGEAKSGEEALEAVARLNPQLVLMDINMEGMGGIEASRRIRADHAGTKVILLSTYDEDDLPADARTCGAIAYVHKERFGPDILENTWGGADGNGGAHDNGIGADGNGAPA